MSRATKFALPLVGVGVLAFLSANTYAHCGKCAGDCKEMVKALDTNKVTLAKALEAAETASKGKAIGVNSKWAGGKMDMSVTCMVGDKAMSVAVDGAGKAGKSEDAKGVTGGGDILKYMDAAKLTMAKVIEAGEAHSKGKALAVTAKAAAGKASYEVYCLAGDKLQNVKVDDAGKATGMTEAKELPANEEKPKPKPGG